jgi:hypothetical protein
MWEEKSIPGIEEGIKYGIESAMFHKILFFKAGVDFLLWSALPPSREPIPGRD